MWASNEAAQKAGNGTHIAIRIDNLRFGEGSDDKSRVDLVVDSLTTVDLEALQSDICVGLTPDQGKRIRYQAIAIAAMADSAPPRLHAILDGQPEGIIQFHELSGVGSIGGEKRGDLMAGFTKVPFYGAAYAKRGLVNGVALMSRASMQPHVEYASGLLRGVVAGIARDIQNSNQHEITKLNEKLAATTGGVELANLGALKKRKIDQGHASSRVLMHAGGYFTAYAEQARMFDVRGALVELTGVLPRGAQQGDSINIARSHGREVYVLAILQRLGDVEPITLSVLNTVWNRLKGKGGTTFARLATKLWKEAPTIVDTARPPRRSRRLTLPSSRARWLSHPSGSTTVRTACPQSRTTSASRRRTGRPFSRFGTSKCSTAWRWRMASICAPRATSTRSKLRRSTAHQKTARGTSRTRSSKLIA